MAKYIISLYMLKYVKIDKIFCFLFLLFNYLYVIFSFALRE